MSQTYTVGGKVFCSNCGSEVRPGKTFCSGCGAQLPYTQPPVYQQQSVPQQKGQTSNATTHLPPQSTLQQPNRRQAEPQPLRVIAMQKKFALVACLKDLLLPGHGFIYAESMVEGAVVGLITIPLTVWAVLNYIQLWFTDLIAAFRNSGAYGGGTTPDFSASDNFKVWLIGLSLLWLAIRFVWLWYCVQEHNKEINKLADVNQLVAFVDGK